MRRAEMALRACMLWLVAGTLAPTTGLAQHACRVVDVTISPPEATVKPGDTLTLYPTAYDPNGSLCVAATFTWSSSDVHLVTVDRNGHLKGIARGVATITARTGTGRSARSASVVVTVRSPVGTIQVQPTNAQVSVGEDAVLRSSI